MADTKGKTFNSGTADWESHAVPDQQVMLILVCLMVLPEPWPIRSDQSIYILFSRHREKWICRFMSSRLLTTLREMVSAVFYKSPYSLDSNMKVWKQLSEKIAPIFNCFFGSSRWLGKIGQIATNLHDISAFWITEKSEELRFRGPKPGLYWYNYFRL